MLDLYLMKIFSLLLVDARCISCHWDGHRGTDFCWLPAAIALQRHVWLLNCISLSHCVLIIWHAEYTLSSMSSFCALQTRRTQDVTNGCHQARLMTCAKPQWPAEHWFQSFIATVCCHVFTLIMCPLKLDYQNPRG